MVIRETGSSKLKQFRGVPAEDAHNIQTHLNSLDLLVSPLLFPHGFRKLPTHPSPLPGRAPGGPAGLGQESWSPEAARQLCVERGFSAAPGCPPHPSAGESARRVTPRGQAPPNGPAFILAHRTKPKRRKPYYLNKTGSLPSPPGSSPPRLAVRSTAAGRGPHDTSLFQRQSRVRKWLLLAVACPPRGPRWPLDSRTGGIAAQRRRVWGWRRRGRVLSRDARALQRASQARRPPPDTRASSRGCQGGCRRALSTVHTGDRQRRGPPRRPPREFTVVLRVEWSRRAGASQGGTRTPPAGAARRCQLTMYNAFYELCFLSAATSVRF